MPSRTCPAGSEPFPGALQVSYFEYADMLFILGLIGSPALDVILLPFVDAAFDATVLCNADPPDPPTFGAFDFLDLEVLSRKAQDLIKSYMWDVWCRCKAADLPATPDWDVASPPLLWGTAANLMLGGWVSDHVDGKVFGISDAIPYPNVQQSTNGWFVFFKGTADVTPYPNNGKPTSQSALLDAQLGYWVEWFGFQPTWPGYDPAKEGHFYVYDQEGGTLLLQGGPTEVLGVFDLGGGSIGPPDPPTIPDTIHFPAEIEATLELIVSRIKALEVKLDLLIPMADARLPRETTGWERDLVSSDLVGVDVYEVGAPAFLVELSLIPDSAGKRPGPFPLYEVNARALQLGWVAWTETTDEMGWRWQTLDMSNTFVIASEGIVQSVELSLSPGVVANLWRLTRVYG